MTLTDALDKKRMKEKVGSSRYNHFFEQGDRMLAYNAFTNCFAELTREKYELAVQLLEKPNGPVENEEVEKLRKDMVTGGFLLDSQLDELEILKMQNRVGRFNNNFLALTIAPTLQCNFNCQYCFETSQREKMSPQVEENVLKFANLKMKNVNDFHVEWFGGEPLMAIDIIERLSSGFKELCQKHEVKYSQSSIITNGFLLSREYAERLRKSNITGAQLTLDGPPNIHNDRRKLKNGSGTFEKILENIKTSRDILNIVVRVNIDKNNVDHLDEFYDIWQAEGLMGKVPFYLGQVLSDTDACADISSNCFSTMEYSAMLVKEIEKAREKGINISSYPRLHRYGFCIADKLNGFIISPSGLLFKCWEEIDFKEENSVGNVNEVPIKPVQVKNLTSFLNWDPFEKHECKTCNILPICSGGCPAKTLNASKGTLCNSWKFNLYDMLKLKFVELQKKNEAQQKQA